MRLLILGLGNELFGDDGVGLYAARALKAEFEAEPKGKASGEVELEVEVLESPLSGPGPAILDLLIGYDRAIIIDAVKTRGGSPGEIYELELDPEALAVELEPASSPSLHYAGLPEALALAGALGLALPKLKVYAVEAGDLSLGAGLTERVARALPGLLAKIREDVRSVADSARHH